MDRFNQNRLGQLFADGESSVAHLADKIGLAGEQLDNVVLAKSQLAESILNFGRRAQLLNPNRYPGLDSVQGTNFATGFVSHFRVGCSHPVHNLLGGVSRLCPSFTTHKLSFYGHNLHTPSPDGVNHGIHRSSEDTEKLMPEQQTQTDFRGLALGRPLLILIVIVILISPSGGEGDYD